MGAQYFHRGLVEVRSTFVERVLLNQKGKTVKISSLTVVFVICA